MIKILPCKILLYFFFFAAIPLSGWATTPDGNNLRHAKSDTTTKVFQPLLVDENEEPIYGIEFLNLRTNQTDLLDSTGNLKMSVQPGDVLQIKLQGSVIKEYVVTDDLTPVIAVDAKNIVVLRNKPVRLLNNISVPSNLTATSTQTVYNNDITKLPVTSVRNALIGQLAGLYTNQLSGQPNNDFVSFRVRGRTPVVFVDGVPWGLQLFDLDEIESVTILKDALSTAPLGVVGSNGALLVTTRKGSPNKQRISFTFQSAIQQPLKFPKALNAYDYSRLYNEALDNDGLAPVYSDADLDAYKNHTDPYGHPDVNWKNQVLKSSSRLDRYTLNVSGGNNFAQYFVLLEHFNQTGLFKQSDLNSYNTNNYLQGYTIRSNVDLNIRPKLTGGIHLLGRVLNENQPGYSTSNIISSILTTPSNAYPVYNPDGSYGGAQQYQTNIWAQTIGSGYLRNYDRDVMVNFYLKQDLDVITPGLWVKALASYDATLWEYIVRNKTFAVYQRNVLPDGTETYQMYGTNGTQSNYNYMVYQARVDYLEGSLGYNRRFGNHGINAIVLGSRYNIVENSDLPYTVTGASSRLAYDFKEKYVMEFSGGLNGSNRYPPKGTTKLEFFPAVGLAWNITKETFLKNSTLFNNLKLYSSYGLTGWDNAGYFTYIQRYYDGPTAYFGTGAGGNTTIDEQPLANPDITYEKAKKLNIGLQGSLLHNHLSFVVEYYNNEFYDLLMVRGKNVALLGNTYPNENIGRSRYMGWDFQATWQQAIKKINYFVTVNAGIQDSKVLFIDEVYRPYSWMKRTGRQVDQAFGYIADGLFQSTEDISKSATIDGYTPHLGDIKYKDLNQDGVINQFDVAPVGVQKPLFTYGINFGFNWKFLDFSGLVQGVANRNNYLYGNSEWEFQNNGSGQAYEQHLNRWTQENAANATYPRLTVGTNVNNHIFSSYWVHSGDYVRLKFLEIGCTISGKALKRLHLQSARLFVNGTNLFTKSSYDRVDPEVFNGAYPNQRLMNMGFNIKF